MAFSCALSFALAQSIQFELSAPAPPLQDADVGAMAFGDVDGDGDSDLLVTGKGGPIKTTLYQNDGQGNFTEWTGTPFENVYAGDVSFADVDQDNDLDVLITGKTSMPVHTANLYLNDGTGSFTLAMGTPFEPSEGGEVVFGDIDQDNDLDVLMNGYDAMGMGFSKVYLNNGMGTFTEELNSPFAALKAASIALFDRDQDNDLDVLMIGEDVNGQPTTLLYTNDGAGAFSLVPNAGFSAYASGDIAVADTDNDGDQDVLLCGSRGLPGIASELYLNDGMGTFTLLAGTNFAPVHIGEGALEDFDNDGDMDVFLLGAGPNGLFPVNDIVAMVYENEGNNVFVQADSLIGAYLSSVAIADADGDNDLDLVIGGTSTGSPVRGTRMYTNRTPISAAGIVYGKSLNGISLYPNPTTGTLYLEQPQAVAYSVRILNAAGQVVYTQPKQLAAVQQLSLTLPPGLYTVLLEAKDALWSEKVMMR